MGRPTTEADPSCYTPELAEKVLAGLRRGLSVRAVCRAEGMPHFQRVFDWLHEQPSFAERYARARFEGCEALADELFEISDDAREDWVIRQSEGAHASAQLSVFADHEHIARSKLRVDTRKWYLSKIVPKIYGDHVQVEHKGNIDLTARLTLGRQRALGVDTLEDRSSAVLIEGSAVRVDDDGSDLV